jgi:hypothetical protein
MARRIEQAKIENIGLKKKKRGRDCKIPTPLFLFWTCGEGSSRREKGPF